MPFQHEIHAFSCMLSSAALCIALSLPHAPCKTQDVCGDAISLAQLS